MLFGYSSIESIHSNLLEIMLCIKSHVFHTFCNNKKDTSLSKT